MHGRSAGQERRELEGEEDDMINTMIMYYCMAL